MILPWFINTISGVLFGAFVLNFAGRVKRTGEIPPGGIRFLKGTAIFFMMVIILSHLTLFR